MLTWLLHLPSPKRWQSHSFESFFFWRETGIHARASLYHSSLSSYPRLYASLHTSRPAHPPCMRPVPCRSSSMTPTTTLRLFFVRLLEPAHNHTLRREDATAAHARSQSQGPDVTMVNEEHRGAIAATWAERLELTESDQEGGGALSRSSFPYHHSQPHDHRNQSNISLPKHHAFQRPRCPSAGAAAGHCLDQPDLLELSHTPKDGG